MSYLSTIEYLSSIVCKHIDIRLFAILYLNNNNIIYIIVSDKLPYLIF